MEESGTQTEDETKQKGQCVSPIFFLHSNISHIEIDVKFIFSAAARYAARDSRKTSADDIKEGIARYEHTDRPCYRDPETEAIWHSVTGDGKKPKGPYYIPNKRKITRLEKCLNEELKQEFNLTKYLSCVEKHAGQPKKELSYDPTNPRKYSGKRLMQQPTKEDEEEKKTQSRNCQKNSRI